MKKILVIGSILILIMTAFMPCANAEIIVTEKEDIDENLLDIEYIYKLTERLSNIIFTEYNESAGELAKGRFFGTKGEHKAAEILYENMTTLGLYTKMEKIGNIPKQKELTHLIETHDYGLRVNNITIDKNAFHITPSNLGPRSNPDLRDYNFSYKNLKIIPMPKLLTLWSFIQKFSKEKQDFVFITDDGTFIPEGESPFERLVYKYINHIRYIGIPLYINKGIDSIKKTSIYNNIPHWKGIIRYDLNDDVYNMGPRDHKQSFIHINGTLGKKILKNIDNITIDYYINQSYNDSIISYNVIGQLNGTDPSKTVIVDCLYDSWWCQGTADSAIGMAMVLAIAKYFVDHNITPKYNIKFIAFGGEEAGIRGAYYYEYAHRDENIIYVFDLNQLGFSQEKPKLTLQIIGSKLPFLFEVMKIAKKTDYVNQVNNSEGLIPLWMPIGAPSDDKPFACSLFRPKCKTVCFLKGYYWVLHHRDGSDHTKGDVLDYFDQDDVNVTGEIILNIIKHFTT